VFLDVVMESEAGLEVARWMRQDLDNQFTRIVLRTGQPGQAPEERVIVNYDINDYKEKTELDRTKLFTTTFAALRAYRDIMKVEEARRAHALPRRAGARDRRLGPHLPAAQPERFRQRPAAGGGPAAAGQSMLLRLRAATAISGETITKSWPRSATSMARY
jgi:CheY-like chemotaxis protein